MLNVFIVYRSFDGLFQSISNSADNGALLHVGYSNYRFNEDRSFELNDRQSNQQVLGTWELYQFGERELLILQEEANESISGTKEEFRQYFYIEESTEEYLILSRPNCIIDHGRVAPNFQQFLKRL